MKTTTVNNSNQHNEKTFHFHFISKSWTDFLMDHDISSSRTYNNVQSGFCKESEIDRIKNKFSEYNVIFMTSDIYWSENWIDKLNEL